MTCTRTGGNGFVIGTLVFLETHRRLLGGQFGKIPRPLQQWAFDEGGYSIDAPETLPAGGCEWVDAGPPPDGESEPWGLPDQITVAREIAAKAYP